MLPLGLFAVAGAAAATAVPPASCGSGTLRPDAACSCADFCAGTCACSPGPAAGVQNLSLVRLTPFNITDLACKNTGDAAGDVFFTLDRIALAEQCRNEPDNPRCFLDGSDVYIDFTVEVDGKFGPYQRCNPLHGSLSEPFYCCQQSAAPCRGERQRSGIEPYCACDRQNHTVGVESIEVTHTSRSGWVGAVAKIVGGRWYSTPREGMCQPPHRPGDGSGCTWRVVGVAATKNATCVRERTFQAIYTRGASCFRQCPGWPHSLDWTTECYVHCFQSTVLGNASVPPMTQAELVGPFTRALELTDPAEGGCPSLALKLDDTEQPAATPRRPPLLSRRAEALASSSFDLTVGHGGALSLDVNGVAFAVTSGFSEVGPHWNNLTLRPAGGSGWAGAPTVDASGAAMGRWVVTAKARNYTLTRVVQLDPPPPSARTDKPVSARRLLINDTIVNTAPATIGMSIRHDAALVKGGAVDGVTVPGLLSPGSCGTDDNPGNFCGPGECDRDAHRMNGASPHIFLNATSAAAASASLGLAALDDIFRVHAETRNFAVKQLNPRVPGNCAVSSPPSIRLSDPVLALAAGASQTHEWAIYPSSNCTDFFCLVNALRHDYGTDEIVLGKHRGVLQAMEHATIYSDMSEWSRSGYVNPACNNTVPPKDRAGVCTSWLNWSSDALLKYMGRQGVNVMPIGNGVDQGGDLPCGHHLEMNGAMFVNGENPPTSGCDDCYANHEALIRKVVSTAARVSTPERPITSSYYIDTSISTGANDWETFADSRVLDVNGQQVLYRPCTGTDTKYANQTAARQGEMPMFVGTLTNSYGPIIKRYVDKIFALGINGVYHDEYGYSLVAYTYGTWDNHSAFLHPSDLSIRALVGSLDLLSMELELEIQKIIAANDGFFMANGKMVILSRFACCPSR